MQSPPCLHTHAVLFTTEELPATTYSTRNADGNVTRICLLCFLEALQNNATQISTLLFDHVVRTTTAIVKALSLRCPDGTAHDNAAQREWLRRTLSFRVDSAAANLSDTSGTGDGAVQVGSVLADIVVALYRLHIRVSAKVESASERERSTAGSRHESLIDLGAFVCAGWELLLQSPTMPSTQPQAEDVPAHLGVRASASRVRRFSSFSDTLRDTDVLSTFQNLNALVEDASRFVEAASNLVERLVFTLTEFCAGRDETRGDSAASDEAEEEGEKRHHLSADLNVLRGSYVAAQLLYEMLRESNLLRRSLCVSDAGCALARIALPIYVDHDAARPPSRKRPRHDNRNTTDDRASPRSALWILLEMMQQIVYPDRYSSGTTTKRPATDGNAVIQNFIAKVNAASWTGERWSGGTPFLCTLLQLLEMPTDGEPVTLTVLALLQESLAVPAVRRHLLDLPEQISLAEKTSFSSQATQRQIPREELLGDALPPPTPPSSTTPAERREYPTLLDFAYRLQPLLLEYNDQIVRSACAVLTQLLTSSFTHDVAAAAADRAAVVAVARFVEASAVSAVRASVDGTRASCAVLVELLELVAVVLDNAQTEAVRHSSSSAMSPPRASRTLGGDASRGSNGEAGGGNGSNDRGVALWQVVFLVAQVGVSLFERLVCGHFFRRAVRGADAQDDGSELSAVRVDWNAVLASGVTNLLQNAIVSKALSLHGYLCYLAVVASGVGDGVQSLWHHSLALCAQEVTRRVKACMDNATVAAARVNSAQASSRRLLRDVLSPPTHQLLLQVTAAFFPSATSELWEVAEKLLMDVVVSRELPTSRCPSTSEVGYREVHMVSPEEECACLLRLAITCLEEHKKVLWQRWQRRSSNDAEEHQQQESKENVCCCMERCDGELPVSVLHELFTPSRHAGKEADPSLFDVLLSFYTQSPALAELHVVFIEAIQGDKHLRDISRVQEIGRCGTEESTDEETSDEESDDESFSYEEYRYEEASDEETSDEESKPKSFNLDQPLLFPIFERLSLADLSFSRASETFLLFALTSQTRVPCGAVSEANVNAFLKDQLGILAVHLDAEGEATRPAAATVATREGWTCTPGERKIFFSVKRVLSLFIARLRWWPDASLPCDLCKKLLPLGGEGDGAAQSFMGTFCLTEQALASKLLQLVANSLFLRRGLRRFFFDAAWQFGVDVRWLLASLNSVGSGHISSGVSSSHESLRSGFLCGLEAAIMLSFALSERDDVAARSVAEGEEQAERLCFEDQLSAFVHTVVSYRWLADQFRELCLSDAPPAKVDTISAQKNSDASVAPPAQFLLVSLFGVARQSLNAAHCTRTALMALQYVLGEAQHLVALLQSERNGAVESWSAHPQSIVHVSSTTVSVSAVSRAFFDSVLCTHIEPLLSAVNLSCAPPLRVGIADDATAALLQLSCLCLWVLPPSSGTQCDRALLGYAMQHVRACLGLTTDELCHGITGGQCEDDKSRSARATARLMHRVMQLLYLLLIRSGRDSVVTAADAPDIRMFVAAAKQVVRRNDTLSEADAFGLYVLATVVCVHMETPTRRIVDIGYSSSAEVSNDGARFALFGRDDLVRFTQGENTEDLFMFAALNPRRALPFVAGMEYALHYFIPAFGPLFNDPSGTVPPVSNGFNLALLSVDAAQKNQWIFGSCLTRWCTHQLSLRSSMDGDESVTSTAAMKVAARLLYLLARHSGFIKSVTQGLAEFLLMYCHSETGVHCADAHTRLVADAWVLAACLKVFSGDLLLQPSTALLERKVLRYLQLPDVSTALRAVSTMSESNPSRGSGGTRGSAGTAGDFGSPQDVELELALLVLIHRIRIYENGRVFQAGQSVRPGHRFLPVDLQVPLLPIVDVARPTRWWTPYMVPLSDSGSESDVLLLIFNRNTF